MSDEEALDKMIAEGLAASGWAVIQKYFPAAMTAGLLQDVRDRRSMVRKAGTGREVTAGQDAVRTDTTLWLDGGAAAQAEYLARMERLRAALNQSLFLGLFDYECHYALYQAGGFYKKHLDSLRGTRNRVVSCVTYLTPDWREEDGGHLVLYDSGGEDRAVARILPLQGTLAVFLSEELPHEVRPPARERVSIAGWFRCNASVGGRVDPLS